MAVLTKQELERRVRTPPGSPGRIGITPLLDSDQIGSDSIDIRLGSYFTVFRRTRMACLDVGEDSSPYDFQEMIHVPMGQRLIIPPSMLLLGVTLEYMAVPSDLCCHVVTRSSWGRLGVIIATAVWVHPNFTGCLTLELVNNAEAPVALYPGTEVGQLVFHSLDSDAQIAPSQYEGQTRPLYSKLFSNRGEIERVRRIGDRFHGVEQCMARAPQPLRP
jgi:dCTP deaminase